MDFYAKLGIRGWPKNLQYAILGCLAANYSLLLVGRPGSSKTRFIRHFGALMGKRTRIYDVDKLSFEVLLGDLSPEFIGQTSAQLHGIRNELRAYRTGEDKVPGAEMTSRPVTDQFINGVCDYEIIGWDEILRGHPATQQSLLLNIMQDKTFQGRTVNALQISCTNTDFDELYEFNEALLNRFHLIVQCPRIADLSEEVQNELIESFGHNKPSDIIEKDKNFYSQFTQLQEFMSRPPLAKIERTIKHFLKHLKHPLSNVLNDRMSGRALDNMAKVLYVTLLTYRVLENVKLEDMNIEDLRSLMRDTFLSTIYMNDLTPEQRRMIETAFHLSFLYTFCVEELSLRDRLLSVPNFLVNCEDFTNHINNMPVEKQDLGGISIFIEKLKKECRNNEPLRYILYKWLSARLEGKQVKIEADIINPIRDKLASMEKKLGEFTAERAEIVLESSTLNAEFLDKIQAAEADRAFLASSVDPDIHAGLITAMLCFGTKEEREDGDHVSKMYHTYAQLRRI